MGRVWVEGKGGGMGRGRVEGGGEVEMSGGRCPQGSFYTATRHSATPPPPPLPSLVQDAPAFAVLLPERLGLGRRRLPRLLPLAILSQPHLYGGAECEM